MRKITPEIIDEVKKRRKKGEKLVDICKDLQIPHSTLSYHLDEDYKEYKKDIEREKSKKYKLSDEQKERRRIYYNNYFKNRYKNDPEFRKKHIARVSKKQKENYKSKKNKNENS